MIATTRRWVLAFAFVGCGFFNCVDTPEEPTTSQEDQGLAICRECQYVCIGGCAAAEDTCYRGCQNNNQCEVDCLDAYNSCVDVCMPPTN